MPASTLAFLVELTNASHRHLNFLFIDITFTKTSVITNISIFLTIDEQNNESEVEVNAVAYPVQNTAQISKLIYLYYKLSVCLWVDTKMLVRDILADLFIPLFFMLIVLRSGVIHSSAIPIMRIGHYTSCSIVVEGGKVCEICSQPSTTGDSSIAQNIAPKGTYY